MDTFIKTCVMLIVMLQAGMMSAQSGRAARYQPGDWVTYNNFQYVTSFEEGDHYLYVGTTHGVLRFNQLSHQWEYPYTIGSGLSDGYVLNIAWVKENQELWVISRGGIDVIYTVLNRWKHIPGSENNFGPVVRRLRVGQTDQTVILVTNNGNSYIYNKFTYSLADQGTGPVQRGQWKDETPVQQNLALFLNSSWHVNQTNNTLVDEYFDAYPFTVQFSTQYNELYLGTWGAGFIKADATTQVGDVMRVGPLSASVGAVFKGSTDLWFGSAGLPPAGQPAVEGQPGISRWDLQNNQWDHVLPKQINALSHPQIFSIKGDDHGVWVGTNRGLLHYNMHEDSWTRISGKGLASSPVYDIVVDDTTVWAASDIGLYDIANPTGIVRQRFSLVQNQVLSIFSLSQVGHRLFAGSEYGLIELDVQQKQVYYYDKNGQRTSPEKFPFLAAYQVTARGDLLFYSNQQGIYQLNLQTGEFSEIPELGLAAQSQVRVLRTDATTLWVGMNDGAGEYNIQNQEWEFYTMEDGLGANRIYDILIEPDYVWFATQNGVTRFYLRRNERSSG